jgi:HEAT repeats
MVKTYKIWKLSSALKDPRHLQEALSAVLELGRLGHDKAVDLLIEALGRCDSVSRSAARELGRIGNLRAIRALGEALAKPQVSQSAAEALIRMGSPALETLLAALRHEASCARKLAAFALGEIGDRRAVEPLIQALGQDDKYEVRTAATIALGQLKDARALWVLIATLKLRGETTPERQQALEALQSAAELARLKIGDPLATPGPGTRPATAQEAVDKLEQEIEDTPVHPKLLVEVGYLTEKDLAGVLKDVIGASEEISWAKLENREPLLPPYFQTYDQRRQAAELVGQELFRRGGRPLLDQVLTRDLNGYESVRNWWSGLGA